MLYTTYLSKMNKLPDNITKLVITRFPPKSFDVNKYPNTFIIKELAPHAEILLDYKKDNDWDKYVERFNHQMERDHIMVIYLDKLYLKLSQGKDYALVCYEKDYEHCHRYLIAKYLENKGIEWKEF